MTLTKISIDLVLCNWFIFKFNSKMAVY